VPQTYSPRNNATGIHTQGRAELVGPDGGVLPERSAPAISTRSHNRLTAGSLTQQEKGTPQRSRLGFKSVQLK
jgi:hypothetical protein